MKLCANELKGLLWINLVGNIAGSTITIVQIYGRLTIYRTRQDWADLGNKENL